VWSVFNAQFWFYRFKNEPQTPKIRIAYCCWLWKRNHLWWCSFPSCYIKAGEREETQTLLHFFLRSESDSILGDSPVLGRYTWYNFSFLRPPAIATANTATRLPWRIWWKQSIFSNFIVLCGYSAIKFRRSSGLEDSAGLRLVLEWYELEAMWGGPAQREDS